MGASVGDVVGAGVGTAAIVKVTGRIALVAVAALLRVTVVPDT